MEASMSTPAASRTRDKLGKDTESDEHLTTLITRLSYLFTEEIFY